MWTQELGAESIVRDPLLFENYASTFSFQCYSIVFLPFFFLLLSNSTRDRNTTFHPLDTFDYFHRARLDIEFNRSHSLHLIGYWINLSYKSPPIFLRFKYSFDIQGKKFPFVFFFLLFFFTIHRIWIFKLDPRKKRISVVLFLEGIINKWIKSGIT